jgi:RecA/RadA recombinase
METCSALTFIIKYFMSVEIPKKRRGRPSGSAKKDTAHELAVESLVDNDVIESPPAPVPGVNIDYGFHFLDSEEDYGDKFKVALDGAVSSRKNQSVSFKKMSEIQEGFAFPFKHFLLQYAVGQYGVPPQKIIDIIGAEGIGKSTLVMDMLGSAMDVGCPALYLECESKQIPPPRVMRALHPSITRAYKMLNRLRVEPVNSLDHMWQAMKDFVYIARGTKGTKDTPRVPMHVPIVIAVDPWSKLLNPDEAAGFYNYGDNMSDAKKKKFKEINEGSNLGHAKWAHKWCRLLPAFLKQYNVVLIIVHHQNDKIDMGGSGPSFMTPETSALHNKTRIGGKALHQNTALTLILSRRSLAKNGSGDITGNLISCRVGKNSLGHDNVKFFYELRTGFYNDTLTHMDPAINFNIGFATMCAEQKWMSTSVKGSKFSSPVLGVTEVSADEFCEAFNANQEVKFNLGKQLGINGYVDVVDNIKSTIEKNYHADHDDSVESEVELGTQIDEAALKVLRQKMEQGNAFNVVTEEPTTEQQLEVMARMLDSMIEDVDKNQEVNYSEDFPTQDE